MMNQETTKHCVRLDGCASTPLAGYLKALGVFRIIVEQADPEATACWQGNTFCLASTLEAPEIVTFFAEHYRPTPVIAPWNGGSGFHPGENRDNIDKLLNAAGERFASYRSAISTAVSTIDALGFPKDDKKQFKDMLKEQKGLLLQHLRNNLNDDALGWLDAVVLLTTQKPQYPPLLGTGGNDGRLDFTSNFMKRLDALFDIAEGTPTKNCRGLLNTALLGSPVSGLPRNNAIGQFFPGAAGGFNMTSAYEADPVNNTWDFVLMIEGALLFAASSTKRLNPGDHESLSYPFCVYTSSAAYGSAAASDEESSRAELWAPLWSQESTLLELKTLLSEGRAQIGRSTAVRGVDVARAIATLGIDRGISSFRRFGFQERNGLAYLAVDLGLWETKEHRMIHLLKECEVWVERFRRCARGKNVPRKFITAMNRYDAAVMNACRRDGRLTDVLNGLGQMERTIIQSPRTAVDNRLSPLPRLTPDWLDAVDDGSTEFRLACALASIGKMDEVGALRYNMVPYSLQKPWAAYDSSQMDKPHLVWQHGSLLENLLAVLRRRCMDAQRHGLQVLPLHGTCPATVSDITAFIRSEVDEKRLEDFLWGLNAVNWRHDFSRRFDSSRGGDSSVIPPCYALFKLTHSPLRPDGTAPGPNAPGIPFDPAILAQAAAGQINATRIAARRLTASGWKPLVNVVAGAPDHIRRCAAAVLFPTSRVDLRRTSNTIMRITTHVTISNPSEELSRTT